MQGSTARLQYQMQMQTIAQLLLRKEAKQVESWEWRQEKLLNKLLNIAAPKIVYVSCNVATQARDINLLSEKYRVQKIQPVDMFPHTDHIECVAEMVRTE